MRRAIQLGKNGLALAAPNPSVGCILVVNEKIIGEGFTSPFGGPHAEVNAINAVKNKSLLIKATLYVTLEPCSHFGKTPPCVDLIMKHDIPRVVIGLLDPNPKVAGNGIKALKASGCEVVSGVLAVECTRLHKRFLSHYQKKRPYITLKWAESLDGYIAPKKEARAKNPTPFWITNRYSRQYVHRWRSEEMAILVGTHTVLEDNPKLTVRDWVGPAPIRILFDRHGKIPSDHHVLDGSVRTIIFTENPPTQKGPKDTVFKELDFSKPLAQQICTHLYQHNIHSVLVEGGSKTLETFIDAGLWDEAFIFKGVSIFKNGIKAPTLAGERISTQSVLKDTLIHLRND